MTGATWKLFLALWFLGMLALSSLLAAPLEQIQPAQLHVTPFQFRLLSLINPLILLTVLVAVGSWLAPKIELDAPVLRALTLRQTAWPALKPQLIPALVIGVVVAVILLVYARVTAPWFAAVPHADLPMPLITKLLYGGIVEELLTRWGLMTLFVWLGWKLAGSPVEVPGWAYAAGALMAALLFAAGHLPLLYLLTARPTADMIAAVLVGNSVPGLLFAWAFRRRGLEAAMIAHALAHLISTVAS